MEAQEKKKFVILYISANYDEENILWTNKEFDIVKETIEKSPLNRFIILKSTLALERHDLRRILTEYRPHIIHFSGHGEFDKGPLFQGDREQYERDLLSDTINVLKDFSETTKLIVFNCCQSVNIAEKMREFTSYLIGTNSDVSDEPSIGFAQGFYEILTINDSIENAFKNGVEKYMFKYNQNEEDYIFYKNEVDPCDTIENFISNSLWDLYLEEFAGEHQEILKWALILTINLIPTKIKNFIHIFSFFFNQFFTKRLNERTLNEISNEINPNNIKNIIPRILRKIYGGFENIERTTAINIEDLFNKFVYLLKRVRFDIQKNLNLLNLISISLNSKLKVESPKYFELLLQDFNKNQLEWNFKINLLIENIDNPLHSLRNINQDTILEFTRDELLEYCEKQIEFADLSSQFGYHYDKNLFLSDPDLKKTFERFIDNMGDKNNRERIFLLLGHMGLGKTWNASHLAFKYVKQFPTFYYHLGSSYETQFDFTLGGFDLDKSRIQKLSNKINGENGKILVIFDGFDELSLDERKDFLPNLTQLVEENSRNLIILLTSRLVDWVNTSVVIRKAREHQQYIFGNEEFENFEGISIRTGASFILSDIKDDKHLKEICAKYGIEYDLVIDPNVREILRKPFILNIISRINKELIEKPFKPKDNEWFDLFANPYNKDTILKRMGIVDDVADTFKELVCEIADPYTPIPEDELKPFINNNKKNWDVIYSSGIIRKRRRDLQYEYYFKEEYQGFSERYITELKAHFHDNWICKADVNCLKKIEDEIGKLLNDISDFRDKQTAVGYVINEYGRVVELHLWSSDLKFVPSGVSKLIGLEKLNLRNNNIIKIPESLGRLINLKELNFSENQIINIPEVLTNLINLERLNLMKNQIQSIEFWWKDFKLLKFINISDNKHKIGHQNKDLPSIDLVANDLDIIDDKLTYFFQLQKDYEPLKIKDAVIIDYLNYHRLKSNQKFSFSYTLENFSLKSLTLTDSPKLKKLFWSLKHLDTLILKKNQTEFMENAYIKNLDITDTSKHDENFELKLFESIGFLKNLEVLKINGFSSITLPTTLKNCLKLKQIHIFSKKLKNLPLLTLELENIHNLIINSPLEENEFNHLIKKSDNDLNLGIVRFATNINLPDLVIKPHIKNFFLTHVSNLPNKIEIESNVKKLIIIQSARFPSGFLEKIQFDKNIGQGNFFFNCKTFTLPSIINDFKNLTHLRIDNAQLGKVPDWALKSPHIEKLMISSENFPTTPEVFFEENNIGTIEIRLQANCNLSNINVVLKNLKHLRINLPNLRILPEFIGSLTQMKQFLITSTKFDDLTSEFGTKLNEYRLEIRTNTYLALNDSIGNLKKITHFQINHINATGDFNIIANLTKLTNLRIIHGNFIAIPSFIESLRLIKQLHIYSQGENPFRTNFWSNQDKGRFEFQTSNKKFVLQHMINITHLRISGHSNINVIEEELENLKYLRIENTNQIPSYVQKMKNLIYMELEINNVRIIPDWISIFSEIKKLVITTKRIEFFKKFWEDEIISCFKIKVEPYFNNFEFIKYFNNLSHLWVDVSELKDFPNVFEKLIEKNKQLMIYKGNEVEDTFDDYLEIEEPNFFIIKVHSDCSLSEKLEQYIVEI